MQSSQLEKEWIMLEFNNISIVKKANVYFDGKVTSRTLIFSDEIQKDAGDYAAWRISFQHGRQRDHGDS